MYVINLYNHIMNAIGGICFLVKAVICTIQPTRIVSQRVKPGIIHSAYV